jgi:hypothetical protein
MSLDDIYKEILSLQIEIAENEKEFDVALQNIPSQVELARTIYKNIKLMEGKLAGLQTFFDQKPDPDHDQGK